jgi:hypothetical protein
MTTNNFSTATIGWVAIITGISAILAIIFLILMYAVNNSFGKVNDVFNSIIGISSVVLAWMLYAEHHAKSPVTSQIALVLAIVGAIFTIVGSTLIIFGFKSFVMAGWYTGIGYALIGLWLVLWSYSMLSTDVIPQSLVVFGIIVGAFMAVGLLGIPGIITRIDSMDTLPWYLYLAVLGYFGVYILYPIWAILLGRHLLLK